MALISLAQRQYKNMFLLYMKYVFRIKFKQNIHSCITINFQDLHCYDKFLSTLLNSSIVRAEAEYWLRNLRLATKVKHVDSLGFVLKDNQIYT